MVYTDRSITALQQDTARLYVHVLVGWYLCCSFIQ